MTTSRKTSLRAVMADEIPEPKKILSLDEAIAVGNYLDILLAQRRDMATSLPNEKGPALAALHRQLSLISKEIAALQQIDAEDTEGGANVDDEAFDAEAI